jgi:dTDP-4-dehydrorhamnose reductase
LKVLVLGASGLIGSSMFRVLNENRNWEVFGTVRDSAVKTCFPESIGAKLLAGVDVEYQDSLAKVLSQIRPDVVVNCVGLTKHKAEAHDPLVAIPINTLMPHRLAMLCQLAGTRLIHISTDCVFSGERGGYVETDITDAQDVYGKSKALGEVHYPHTVTLRTSTIGHELQTQYGLLNWFLSQEVHCKGFTRAYFSGLPTVVFAQIVRDLVIPNLGLSGLYHIAAQSISKFDLLKLIAHEYGKVIDIVADENFVIDRSLNAQRFQSATGYVAPKWPQLIKTMHEYI